MDLVERESDLGALAELLDGLVDGRSRAALIEGPAGIGDADLARVGAAVRPYEAGRYFNFVEERADAAGFFPATVAARLEAARETYDPERLMHANHEIGAR